MARKRGAASGPVGPRFVARLRSLIAERDGGNMSAAARRTHVPQPQLSRILSGDIKSPTIDTVAQIARGYGVSVDDLLGTAGDATVPPVALATAAAVRRALETAIEAVAQLERDAAADAVGAGVAGAAVQTGLNQPATSLGSGPRPTRDTPAQSPTVSDRKRGTGAR